MSNVFVENVDFQRNRNPGLAPLLSSPGAAENVDIQFTFDYSVFSGSANLFKRF
jgi:hypothetical protein